MYFGRVIGNVVASVKTPDLEGIKLLLVQPLDHELRPVREPEVACDTVSAGPGDLVYLTGSREAALALPKTFVPVDAAVVGIIDHI